jgi:hypothetical protein
LINTLFLKGAKVGDNEVVEAAGADDTFARFGSGLGTSILSTSDLDSRNGFFVL